MATQHLQKKKYRILQNNFRTKLGEIDILAQEKDRLVIVEVKAKSSSIYGSASEMITNRKKEKLILLAHELQSRYQVPSVRIDVIAIDNASDQPSLKHYKGVVEFNG